MKVMIEMPNKFLDIAKGILLGACDNENMESELNEAMAKIYETYEQGQPVQVEMETLLEGNEPDSKAAYSQLMIAIATIAVGQTSRKLQAAKSGNLSERIKSLQRQAEELKNKNNQSDGTN